MDILDSTPCVGHTLLIESDAAPVNLVHPVVAIVDDVDSSVVAIDLDTYALEDLSEEVATLCGNHMFAETVAAPDKLVHPVEVIDDDVYAGEMTTLLFDGPANAPPLTGLPGNPVAAFSTSRISPRISVI